MRSNRIREIAAKFREHRRRNCPLIEVVEDRRLLSAVVLQIDPSRSIVNLSGSADGIAFQPQGPGSLTTKYSGTISTDIGGVSIAFTGGSNIIAANSGT